MSDLSRIQFVVSGWSLAFLLLSAGFLFGGYWVFTHPPPPPPPPAPAPYYISKVATSLRPCYQCTASSGKLKPSQAWKVGKANDIPPEERWWFAPVEDVLNPIEVDGVPMLALHPALDQIKPWNGFNQRSVVLVVYQDLEPRSTIDHPAPPPVAPEPNPATSEPPVQTEAVPTGTAPQQSP